MTIWIWGFFLLAGGLFAVKMAYVLSTALVLPATRGALYVSTTRARISALLEAMQMEGGQCFLDLGCGDGRVLRAVRKRVPVRAVGYELNPMAWLQARLQCLGDPHIEIRRSDFWKADLSEADVVFCYLFPDVMKSLAEKLRAELRPGTVVASCNFPLPGLSPESILRPAGALHHDPIYIYRMPAANSPEVRN
jgi:SAM-dependent methyltransferase